METGGGIGQDEVEDGRREFWVKWGRYPVQIVYYFFHSDTPQKKVWFSISVAKSINNLLNFGFTDSKSFPFHYPV